MRTHGLLAALALTIAICFTALPTHAQTTHSGDINANQTWYASDNPHIVNGDVRVFSTTGSCTLTVMPGVFVKFDSSFGLQIGTATQQGVLMAIGTADTSIHFGSNATTPLPGDWTGIHFHSHGGGRMAYCQVKQGGHPGLKANITCTSGSVPAIQNCTISDGGGYGLLCEDGAEPTVTGNTFLNNDLYPVQIYGNAVPRIEEGNIFAGKKTNAIEVLGDQISSSAVWPRHSVPYIIAGELEVAKASAGDTLTLVPGTVLRFRPGIGLRVGAPGSPPFLMAVAATSAITFNAADTAKAAPHWAGLYFSSQGSGLLDGCVVTFGGAGGRMANIYCATASDPIIQGCTIQHSLEHGIVCADAALPTILDNLFQYNGQNPISLYANYVTLIDTGNTALSNGENAIELQGDNLTSSVTWPDHGIPYEIAGDVVVFKPALGDTLTLEPGVTLSFNSEVGLHLGQDGHPGALMAPGSESLPITFTSSADTTAPGDWAGIFCDTLGTASLEHCLVEYGGSGTRDANILVQRGGSATLGYTTVRHSDGFGVISVSPEAVAQATNCIFSGNLIGFSARDSAMAISACHLYDNAERGGHNPGNAANVPAMDNWWGHPSGPQDTSPGPPSYNPAGQGDRVTDYVAYDPWWDAPLPTLIDLTLNDAKFVREDTVSFTLIFSRKMDPMVDPLVAFAPANPLEGNTVMADTGWAADSLTWAGSFVFSDSTGDGQHDITVSGARDIWGWPMESDTSYSFFLDTQAPGAQASSPAISAVDTFLVSWSVSDPAPSSGLAGVTVYVAENDTDWVVWLDGATDTSALYPGEDDHTYLFYAVAADSAGNAEADVAAAECTTLVDASIPLVPTMLSPVDAAVVSDTMPAFNWSEVTKAGMTRRNRGDAGTPIKYHFQLAMDELFDSLLVEQAGLSVTTFVPGILSDGLRYWRVAASDDAGNQSGFPAMPFSFSVDTQPPVISGTTAWPDTSFMGPFPVSANVADASDLAAVLLWYRSGIDTVFKADTMEVSGGRGTYLGQIPELPGSGSITVEYYIAAEDVAVPPNTNLDPAATPDTVFSFLAFSLYAGEDFSGAVPRIFALYQNYPNPFNAETVIGYQIPDWAAPGDRTEVSLAVYNVRGQLVRILAESRQAPGTYTVTWDGRDELGRPVSSGIYLVRFQTERFSQTRKAVLLR